MAAKYYTHFTTSASKAKKAAGSGEWSGVVELRHPLEHDGGMRELRSLLARSFDLDTQEIRILKWSRVH